MSSPRNGEVRPETAIRWGCRHQPAAIDGATDPLSGWAKVRETAFAPAEAIAAELRTASAPDLAMLVVADCQLRQALG